LFCHAKISRAMALHVMLLVSLENSWWIGVCQLGLRLFGATMWKLLIIEWFFQRKLNKIEPKNCIGIWGCSWSCWKALSKSNLVEFISQFSELRCGHIYFLVDFVVRNSNELQKLGLKGKISQALDVFTLLNLVQFLKCEK
jgi:hypothetical protein